jgi:fimbrial isopeptide formation D2 family protein/LPXTG-motif cell wall-anchored protein
MDVTFVINTAIPGYAENYTNPVFKITDQLSHGLINNKDYVVTVGGKAATKGTDYTVTESKTKDDDDKDQDKFVISFSEAFIKANTGAAVIVEYSAKIGNDCKENFTPETNDAYITYSNAPDEEKDSSHEETKHYTFSINGKLQATDEDEQRELVKVGIDEDGQIVMQESSAKSKKEWKNLPGATFNLYKAEDCNAQGKPNTNAQAHRTSTSRADGTLDGLDRLDAGEYWLVEQSVPAPYAKKDTPIKVVIDATIENNLLKSYTITVGGVTAASYEATYENSTITNISGADPVDQAADIINTKLGTLPSTGGMGTIIFTVAGIAIMAIAAGLFIANRKNASK